MKKYWPIFVLFLTAIIFFYPIVFWGETFFFGDNLSLFFPVVKFFTQQLKQAKIPFWNPYLFCGVPFFANFSLGILNPLNFLFLFLPGLRALSWEIFLMVFLASVFGFLFLRSLNRSQEEAVVAGIVFAYSASLTTAINNFSILSTSYLLPLVFFTTQKLLQKQTLQWSIISGFILAIQIISGHPQPTFYTLVLVAFYLLFYPQISLRKKIDLFLPSLLVFLVICFFPLSKFWQFARLSNRPRGNFEYASSGSLSPVLLVRFFLPHFFGATAKGFSWGPAYRTVADNTGYFGLIPFFIIVIGWFYRKKKTYQELFFSGVFLMSLILALGKYTPLFYFFYRFLPGFASFRQPSQIFLITDFSAAVLTALFLPVFARKLKGHQKLFKRAGLICFFASFILVLVKVKSDQVFAFLYPGLEKASFILTGRRLSDSPFHSFQIDRAIFAALVGHFLINLVLILLFCLIVYQKKTRLKLSLLLGLIFVSLFVFNRSSFFTTKPSNLGVNKKIATFLKNQNDGHYRYISSGTYWPYTGLSVYWENMSLRPPFAKSIFTSREQKSFSILKNRLTTLPPDWGIIYQLSTPMGYSDLILENYAQFMRQKDKVQVNQVDALPLDSPKLNFLGVRYLLVDTSFPSISKEVKKRPHFSLINHIDNVKIFENTKVMPRAFFQSDQDEVKPVEINKYQPNRVELFIEAEKKGKVVLTDTYYPGWQVLINGKKGKIEKYKGVFRAVQVDPGESRVEFIFKPLSAIRYP